MRVASNYQRAGNLTEAPSIRAALELLSDKEPEEQQGELIAHEAVQHATNCGLMLLQVKARLAHGEWLPWLNGEIESGRLKVGSTQARVYMRVAANKQRGVYLPEAPSIRAALELLSDQEPVDPATPDYFPRGKIITPCDPENRWLPSSRQRKFKIIPIIRK